MKAWRKVSTEEVMDELGLGRRAAVYQEETESLLSRRTAAVKMM